LRLSIKLIICSVMNARALESILSRRDGALGSRSGIWGNSGKGPVFTAEQAQTFGLGGSTLGGSTLGGSTPVLALGVGALDDVLPQRGLACGSVIELQVRGPSGAATSFALSACRAAQRGNAAQWGSAAPCPDRADAGRADAGRADAGRAEPGQRNWCAFIDPSATLFAPGVAQLGLDLDRLLVVRPDVESIGRVAVRIAEANFVSVLVIDLRGAMNDLSVDERLWQRTIRRLALIVKSTATCVLVLTRAQQSQSLPLPTFMRLEFARTSREAFEVRVAKDRTGRVSAPHAIPWSVFDTDAGSADAVEAPGDDWCRKSGGCGSRGSSSRARGFLAARQDVSRKVS